MAESKLDLAIMCPVLWTTLMVNNRDHPKIHKTLIVHTQFIVSLAKYWLQKPSDLAVAL